MGSPVLGARYDRGLGAAARLLASLVAASAVPGPPPATGWLTYGNDPQRTGATSDGPARFLRPLWTRRLPGRITAQPLVVRSVPSAGTRTILVGTSAGHLYALDAAGRERWHVRFGRVATTCPQLDGFGITGTPVVDPSSNTVHVADGAGRLHARDLVSGREREGWPIALFADIDRELVWGALALVEGAVYVPTGSICDRPIEGKIFRVATDTRALTSWTAVPYALGGGGGMWGWGGIAYSTTRDSLLVATGNAFEGGSNTGSRFREWAGYGEHLVELSRDLAVRSSHHPRDVNKLVDLDFAGSPLVVSPRGCPELVVVQNKNGRLYAWRSASIAAGVRWSVRPPGTPASLPLVGQLAYSRATGSVVVATYTKLVRIDLAGRCVPRIAWSTTIGGRELLNGSPTIAGEMIWVARAEPKPALLGVDLRTGRIRFKAALPHPALVAPTVIDGRLYLGTMSGELLSFRVR